MKIRLGFVSNSSSSSFVISKLHLQPWQIAAIKDFCSKPVGEWQDTWIIEETYEELLGNTFMDNCGSGPGSIDEFMKENHFPMDKVKWRYD